MRNLELVDRQVHSIKTRHLTEFDGESTFIQVWNTAGERRE